MTTTAIGLLMYAMTQTRSDIAYCVSVLSQYAHNSNKTHWKAAKRVFHYLCGTLTISIKFKSNEEQTLEVQGYSDSDWESDKDTKQSTTEYVFTLLSGAVSWCLKRQTTVTLFSCEAEYMAVSDTTKKAVWMRGLLLKLEYNDTDCGSVSIKVDNQRAMTLVKNPEYHACTKHIDIQYHFICEVEFKGHIQLTYISTNWMIADGLTKKLTAVKFEWFINLIGLKERQWWVAEKRSVRVCQMCRLFLVMWLCLLSMVLLKWYVTPQNIVQLCP